MTDRVIVDMLRPRRGRDQSPKNEIPLRPLRTLPGNAGRQRRFDTMNMKLLFAVVASAAVLLP
jgi:hypothetical protein